MNMEKLVCVSDFEQAASEALSKYKYEYVKTGADDEYTSTNNRNAFSRWLIRPRMLRDVTKRDVSTTILGKPVKIPIGICPMGFQRTMHPDGEVASAKAAAAVGGIFTLSLFATSSIEEIANAAPNGRNWFQLFMHKDREMTKKLLKRAENAGFEAIVVTVDAQYVGKRRSSRRTAFTFPSHLRLKNALPDDSSSALDFDDLHSVFDFGLTWEVIPWLKKKTRLPIVIKGIQSGDDAAICVSLGADAIQVSNHGGRQIDTASPTINILSEIVAAVDGKCEVYIDGGVTRGSDIFKALALGAKMAFIGRAMIFGIAVNGELGGRRIMEILRDELALTMGLSGVNKVDKITRDYVIYNETQMARL